MTMSKNPLDDVPEVDPATLVCEVGDTLVAVRRAPMNHPRDLTEGDTYRVVGRVYYGWDLQLISGDGPPEVRMLNSQILDYFRIAAKG